MLDTGQIGLHIIQQASHIWRCRLSLGWHATSITGAQSLKHLIAHHVGVMPGQIAQVGWEIGYILPWSQCSTQALENQPIRMLLFTRKGSCRLHNPRIETSYSFSRVEQ